jgi:hypothetical protein
VASLLAVDDAAPLGDVVVGGEVVAPPDAAVVAVVALELGVDPPHAARASDASATPRTTAMAPLTRRGAGFDDVIDLPGMAISLPRRGDRRCAAPPGTTVQPPGMGGPAGW